MKRICLPIFNRATYARIRSVISIIDEHKEDFELSVVLSSSLLWEDYGRAAEYIKQNHPNTRTLEVEICKRDRTNLNMALDTADLISGLSHLFDREKFDAVIVVADRYETIAAAYAANCFNIPVVHFQGGETTGNIDERIRHAVTKMSDYHVACTRLSAEYITEMGELPKRIFMTGCPSLDNIKLVTRKSNRRHCILMYHPVTDHPQDALQELTETLRAVTEVCFQTGIICYAYLPNPDPGREELANFIKEWCKTYNTIFIPMVNEPHDQFLDRLAHAAFIIGNSSAGLRESSYLGIPSINIGDRQGLRERAHNVMEVAVAEFQSILDVIKRQLTIQRYPTTYLYGDGNAAKRFYKILKNLSLKRKGSFTYPLYGKYKNLHMGESRYVLHRGRPRKARHEPKSNRQGLGSAGRNIQSKPIGAWERLCRKAIGY